VQSSRIDGNIWGINPQSGGTRSVTMSIITPAQTMVAPPPTLAPLTPLRITVDEYERIIASGSLNEPSKVELIDGYMVKKMAKSAEHGISTKEVLKALEKLIPPGWTWRQEQPVRMPCMTSQNRTSQSTVAPTRTTGIGSLTCPMLSCWWKCQGRT
jgi:hypothetical protein